MRYQQLSAVVQMRVKLGNGINAGQNVVATSSVKCDVGFGPLDASASAGRACKHHTKITFRGNHGAADLKFNCWLVFTSQWYSSFAVSTAMASAAATSPPRIPSDVISPNQRCQDKHGKFGNHQRGLWAPRTAKSVPTGSWARDLCALAGRCLRGDARTLRAIAD